MFVTILLLFYVLIFWLWDTWDPSPSTGDRTYTLLHWKVKSLTTGSPGKSLFLYLIFQNKAEKFCQLPYWNPDLWNIVIFLTYKSNHLLKNVWTSFIHNDNSYPKSDWLYSLQPKMEKLYTISKNKTRSWLWLRSWTPYCQIQT